MNDILAEIKELEAQREPLLARHAEDRDGVCGGRRASPAMRASRSAANRKDLGDEVPRGFLEILGDKETRRSSQGSGRLELARVGHRSRQPADRPRDGEPHLAAPFRQGPGGNAERFRQAGHGADASGTARLPGHAVHRERLVDQGDAPAIMLSETYQLASAENAANQEIDANNDFLWRFNRQRLDAEVPARCAAADQRRAGIRSRRPAPVPAHGTWGFMQHDPFNAVYPTKRRSVYLMTQRIQRHPFLAMFDGADAAISIAQTAAHDHAHSGAVLHEQRTGPLNRRHVGKTLIAYTVAANDQRVDVAYPHGAWDGPPRRTNLRAPSQYLAAVRERLCNARRTAEATAGSGELPADAARQQRVSVCRLRP